MTCFFLQKNINMEIQVSLHLNLRFLIIQNNNKKNNNNKLYRYNNWYKDKTSLIRIIILIINRAACKFKIKTEINSKNKYTKIFPKQLQSSAFVKIFITIRLFANYYTLTVIPLIRIRN